MLCGGKVCDYQETTTRPKQTNKQKEQALKQLNYFCNINEGAHSFGGVLGRSQCIYSKYELCH